MGLLVDQVLEVLSIEAPAIEATPSLGDSAIDTSFILGVGKAAERVVFLLDIGQVLSGGSAPALAA
jgi:chemotaxis signal transduction protein